MVAKGDRSGFGVKFGLLRTNINSSQLDFFKIFRTVAKMSGT